MAYASRRTAENDTRKSWTRSIYMGYWRVHVAIYVDVALYARSVGQHNGNGNGDLSKKAFGTYSFSASSDRIPREPSQSRYRPGKSPFVVRRPKNTTRPRTCAKWIVDDWLFFPITTNNTQKKFVFKDRNIEKLRMLHFV